VQPAQHGETVAGGVKCLAHLASRRFRERQDVELAGRGAGCVKECDVLGQRVGFLRFLMEHKPHGGGVEAEQFRQGMRPRCRAYSGEFGAQDSR
jgi:hypothetical protein